MQIFNRQFVAVFKMVLVLDVLSTWKLLPRGCGVEGNGSGDGMRLGVEWEARRCGRRMLVQHGLFVI